MHMPWDHDNLRWSSRGKRSKRPEPDFETDEISTADALILLANCDGGFCPSFSTAAASNKSSTSPRSSDSTLISSFLAATSTAVKQKPDSPTTPLVPALTYNNVGHHDSSECGKTFPAHQALGGHMTLHSRVEHQPTAASAHQNSAAATARSGIIHECSVCHEKFSTGQALGGHKRKHYNGPLIARSKAATCQSISNRIGRDDSGERADGGATSHVARPHINLNMPPAEELDAEETQFCIISEM